jgi:hypothetical protein
MRSMKERIIKVNRSAQQSKEDGQRRCALISGMVFLASHVVCPMLIIIIKGMSFEARDAVLGNDESMLDTNDRDALMTIPPGEEAMFFSHAGGTEEVYADVLRQFKPKR